MAEPTYNGQPAMSGPTGPVPVKAGEYAGTPPAMSTAPPTYSQHFAAPPPGVSSTAPQQAGYPGQMDGTVPASQEPTREYYSPQQQQFPQQPQQAYAGAQPPQPQHQASQQNVYQNTTPLYALSSSAAPAQCPSCGARTMTRTQLKSGNTTHAWALGLFLTTCLCCIPYCVSGTKDCEHR